MTREAYADRVRAARDRVHELGLSITWIAEQIDRSRGHVSQVLNRLCNGPQTLLLVEELLDRIEAEVGL